MHSFLRGALLASFVLASCVDDSSNSPAPPAPTSTGTPDSGTPPVGQNDAGGDAAAPVDAGVDANDSAAPITTTLPFNTGVDANRVALADDSVDPHWTVKDANGTALTAYVKTDALGYPGYWMAPSATSKFISPFTDTVDPSGSGTFTYTTTFTLKTGANLGTAKLKISYVSDNAMTAISLNGQAVANVVGGSYSTYEVRELTGTLVVGTNTISFSASNSGGPTGFRAELELTE